MTVPPRILVLLAVGCCGAAGWSEIPHPEKAPLVFGSSTALSGPAANLGIEMSQGMRAAFDEQNERGGIQGRALRLLALDDGYEPERAVPNMHTLINENEVLALVGNVGTLGRGMRVIVAGEEGSPGPRAVSP